MRLRLVGLTGGAVWLDLCARHRNVAKCKKCLHREEERERESERVGDGEGDRYMQRHLVSVAVDVAVSVSVSVAVWLPLPVSILKRSHAKSRICSDN